MIDTQRYSQELEKLRAFSYKLKLASDDKNELVNQLNSVSKANRARLFETYKNLEGPVKVIRKEVSEILNSKNIQLQELQDIVDRAMQANPKSFGRMYKSWYNMLYMFLIADFRDEMNTAVEFISNSTIEELGAKENILAKKFDFTGERETGSTRCWIAFINTTHASQKTAKQLFINIENGEIEYSFYDRPHDIKKDQVILKRNTEFNFDNCILVFKKHLQEILNDTWVQKTSYWRLGSQDDDQSYWEEMLTENKICIGWPNIGDLNASDIKNKKGITKLFDENGYYVNDNRTKGKKAGEIFKFYESIQEQDIVLVQEGSRVLGIGKIKGPYQFNENSGFPHQRAVDWLVISPPLSNEIGLRTTVYQIEDEAKITEIEKLLVAPTTKNTNKVNKTQMNASLNQILFGPPGTGKTYNSINRAIEIINPGFNLKQERTLVKKEYDDLEKQGRIFFTTFHQSMAYEDFMEGIKPLPPKTGESLQYEVQAGIFKIACANAAYLCYKKQVQNRGVVLPYNFDELYDAFIEQVKSSIQANSLPIFRTITGKEVEIYEINSQNSIKARKRSSKSTAVAPLTKENLEKLYNRYAAISEITELQQIRDTTEVLPRSTEFYAVFGGIKEFERNFNPEEVFLEEDTEIDKTEDAQKLRKFEEGVYYNAIKELKEKKEKAEPVVLIIDEINRGNVSQIFGELITLIEDDKRLGQTEALEIILPYSKKRFSVPPNLYIIGTMNTADRSVEALDTALRRRFSFEEMAPKPELLTPTEMFNGINLQLLLQTINTRIEKLLDKDHLIGHSFFMSVNSLAELQTVFYDKIIPLLQECFFGDFGKIGLVLGKGFVRLKSWDKESDSFADFEHESTSEFEQRQVFEIIDHRIKNINDELTGDYSEFKKAIDLLMKK